MHPVADVACSPVVLDTPPSTAVVSRQHVVHPAYIYGPIRALEPQPLDVCTNFP